MAEQPLQDLISAFLPDRFPVLVVDDDRSVLDVTRLVLSRFRFDDRGVDCLEAGSAAEAQIILQSRDDIAVILLDVVMEHDTAGLHLVEYIRNELGNRRIRIILRTGQAGFAPEYRVVQNYDINDYLAKSESTQERLFVSLTTALRGYRDIVAANVYARRALEAEQEREVAALALESKAQFLAHLSHEIRNPLTGLVGIVELLESGPEPMSANQAELLSDLGYTVQSLLGVVDDVLDVAKIEAGGLQLHNEPFNARSWLHRSVAVVSANIRRKEIILTIDCDDCVPEYLIGDASRMQQILVNFLSNACKFTAAGGSIFVRLCADTFSEAGAKSGRENNAKREAAELHLHLSVQDSGIGIHSSKLTEIFKPYQQATKQTALEYGGTGLGLSLCRNLAELMGGHVGVISEMGSGTTFWLDVPIRALPVNDEKLNAIGEAEISLSTRGLNVVVCEDDATNQKTLQVILTKRGITVHPFNNGRELLDDGCWKSADVILMDCHMPVMNGMDATRELRRLGCDVPVVALTAGVSDVERQLCLDSGMDIVMAKPVDFSLLYEQVVTFASRGRHSV